MASIQMAYDNRPDGDLLEVPGVGLFPNGQVTTLSDAQAEALKRNWNLEGDITLPIPADASYKNDVQSNMSGTNTAVMSYKVDENSQPIRGDDGELIYVAPNAYLLEQEQAPVEQVVQPQVQPQVQNATSSNTNPPTPQPVVNTEGAAQ